MSFRAIKLWPPLTLCRLCYSFLLHQPKKSSFLSSFTSPRTIRFFTRVAEWLALVQLDLSPSGLPACSVLFLYRCHPSEPLSSLQVHPSPSLQGPSMEAWLLFSLWIPQPGRSITWPLCNPEACDSLCLCLPGLGEQTLVFFLLSKFHGHSLDQPTLTHN